MRDKSLTGIERNQRMQAIMSGKFDIAASPPPIASTAATTATASLPQRDESSGGADNDVGLSKNNNTRRSMNSASDSFEQRILEKTKSNQNNAAAASYSMSRSSSRDTSRMDSFEQRILEKQKSNANNTTAPSTLSRDTSSSLEQRILAKSKSNANEPSSAVASSSAGRKSTFDERLLEKTKSNASLKNSQSSNSTFEQRILEKSKSNASSTGDSQLPTKNFEQRILEQATSNRINNASSSNTNSSMTSVASSKAGESFEQRVLDKAKSSINNDSLGASLRSTGSNTSVDDRMKLKMSNKGSLPSAEAGGQQSLTQPSTQPSANTAINADKKRQAIKQLMQDKALTPQDRHRRMALIMSGDWDKLDAESNVNGEEDSVGENSGNVSIGDDSTDTEPSLHDMEVSDPRLFASRSPSHDMDDSDPRLFVGESGRNNMTQGDDSSRYNSSLPPLTSGNGVGFGSLPLPEEHFAPRSVDDSQSHPNDSSDEELQNEGHLVVGDPDDDSESFAFRWIRTMARSRRISLP